MKFLDELLIDLQVFAQELLREHLTIKFSSKTLSSCFSKSDTHVYRPIVPFQNGLKRYVFSKSFFWNSSLVIDYKFLVIDYAVISWRVRTERSPRLRWTSIIIIVHHLFPFSLCTNFVVFPLYSFFKIIKVKILLYKHT